MRIVIKITPHAPGGFDHLEKPRQRALEKGRGRGRSGARS
jgi:hypothetical protein